VTPAPSSAASEGESIRIEAHQGARILTVTLDYAAVRELREALNRPDPALSGLLCGHWGGDAIHMEHAAASPSAADTIGLFRAQPGGWSALTPADRKKIKALGLTRGILLVVRTLAQRPWSATLFAIEPEAAGSESPLAEFPWDEYLLQKGWLLDLAPPALPPPRALAAARPRRRKGWAAAAVLLLLSGAAGAAAYRWLPAALTRIAASASPAAPTPAPAPAPPGLELQVVRQAQDLDVSWNRQSEAVRDASAGTLTIRSGVATRIIEMRPEQLREGRVLFHPLAGVDTDVRLELLDSEGGSQAESVQVLGFDTAPAVTLPVPATPKAQQQSADRAVIGSHPAAAIHRTAPDLTPDVRREMRAAGGKVTVSVRVSIDAAGRVDDAEVVSSSGEPSPSGPYIRLASLNAARQWRFRPAMADGRPVASHTTLLFTF
jgi:hypothetical protein